MKKMTALIMCAVLAVWTAGCAGGSGEGRGQGDLSVPESITLGLSTADNDVEYMQQSDLTAFGLEEGEKSHEGTTYPLSGEYFLELNFEKREETEYGFLLSGSGKLDLGNVSHEFSFENQELCRIEVNETNTVYSGVFKADGITEQGIFIDLTADGDFSNAVATVSSEGGYLFFGDVFDDYLEYFYMVMEQTGETNE